MIYTVYLHKGIYFQTEYTPGVDKFRRIEFKDSFRTTYLWVPEKSKTENNEY